MIGVGVVGVMWIMGLVVIAIETLYPRARRTAFFLALISVAVAAVLAGLLWPGDEHQLLAGGGLKLDGFALFVQAFVMLGVVFSLLLGFPPPAPPQGGGRTAPPTSGRGQGGGLLLLSAAGVLLVAMAVDLIAVLAGLTAAMIPLLGLAALSAEPNGREAALKGMVLTVLGAALLGLGTALLASRTGTTTLAGIREFLSQGNWIGDDPLQVASMALILSGLGLFLAVVPFHMLFTDFAEGLPAPAALLLCGCLMASGLAACGRVLLVAFGPVVASGPGYLSWTDVLHTLGLLALLVGNAMALVQRRLKRLLACLAAGQAGMVLITLSAAGQLGYGNPDGQQQAVAGVLVFLAVHAVNWAGLFLAVGAIGGRSGQTGVVRLEGLAREHPWLAAAIGLALLCMAGMPLTAGFFARLYLLETMVGAGWVGTAVAVALSLGLVLVMCLGLVTAMVMRPARADVEVHTSPALIVTAWLSSLAILALGVVPGGVLEAALRSAGSLLDV